MAGSIATSTSSAESMSSSRTEGVELTVTGPKAPPQAVTARPAPARPESAESLVGRSRELEQLVETFDLVAGGRAMGMLIGGDAGIGKSRIVEEFCDRIRLDGAVVATGMCVPADNAVPYAPVVGILRDLGRALGHPTRAAGLLSAMGGRVAPIDPDDARSVPDAGTPASRLPAGPFVKTLFFQTLLDEVAKLAERSPVVLVFEDLHWSDSASCELFDFLIRNLADARVLTLGTYREDELDRDHPLAPALAELSRHPRVRELAVAPLSRPELDALIANTLGGAPGADLLESVWTRSVGNPFFAEELLAAGDPQGLPTGLKAVIDRRVKRLPETAQRLLEVVAAAGAVVDDRLLESAIGWDTETLEAALSAAIDKKILVVDEAGSAFRFRHALLREAVYEALLPAQRRRLHAAIATTLAALPSPLPGAPGPSVSELATHWWAAGEWARALPVSVQAADAAIAALAFPEAHTFLDRALLADTRVPAATLAAGLTRPQLLEKAAKVAFLAGANARAVELAQEAVSAVDPDIDPIAAARCRTLLGQNLWGVGDSAGAFASYQAALALLPGDAPSIERARLLAEEARGYLLMSQFVVGAERAQAAIAAARAVDSQEIHGHALTTLGSCRAGLGFYAEGITLIQQSVAMAEGLADPSNLNRAYANLSQLLLDTGRLDEAVAMMFDSAAVGEDLWGLRLNGGTGNSVEALVRLGRYAEADRVLALLGTQALGVCTPAPWMLPSPMMIRRGRFEFAEGLVGHALEMTSRLGDVQHAAVARAIAGELALERGRAAEAAAAFEHALALASASEDVMVVPELCMWDARAAVDRYAAESVTGGDADLERTRRRVDDRIFELQRLVRTREERSAVATPRLLAGLAQTVAEGSRLAQSDPDLWDRAARLWPAAHEPYPEAYCRWREAEALLEARGARARAGASLQAAYHIAKRLEAEPMLARIALLAQRGRLDISAEDAPQTAHTTHVANTLGLTPREVEILGLLAAGRSDREIAETLFISKKTVSVHVSNVLRKLAVGRRYEAARIGQAHGLGTPAQARA